MAEPAINPASTVDADLACANCGYNLRTLQLDARCPECGQPVRASILPAGLHFATVRGLRRFRLGVALLVVTVLVPLLTRIIWTLAVLAGPRIWDQLTAQTGVAYRAYWLAGRAFSFSMIPAVIAYAIGVALIAQPHTQPAARGAPRTAWTALVLVALATLATLWPEVCVSFSVGYYGHAVVIGALGATLGAWAEVLIWGLMIRRLPRHGHTRLRWAMGLVMVLVGLRAGVALLYGVMFWGLPWFWNPAATTVQLDEPPGWCMLFGEISGFWNTYIAPGYYLLWLLVLWAYIRRLNAGLRPQAV